MAEEKAPYLYSDIVTEAAIKRNKTAIAGRSAMEIWMDEKDNLLKAIRLLGFLPEEKIDVDQYRTGSGTESHISHYLAQDCHIDTFESVVR